MGVPSALISLSPRVAPPVVVLVAREVSEEAPQASEEVLQASESPLAALAALALDPSVPLFAAFLFPLVHALIICTFLIPLPSRCCPCPDPRFPRDH